MPFQPIRFESIAPLGAKAGGNLVDALIQGYQASQLPRQYAQQREQFDMAKEKSASQLKTDELRRRLLEAQAGRMEAQTQDPFGGATIPGSIGQAVHLEKIKEKFGEDSDLYKNARRAFEADQSRAERLNLYREQLSQTMGKRAATPLAKAQQELMEVREGFVPGTRGEQRLAPEEARELEGLYGLTKQKGATDASIRDSATRASNIDKTLEAIDVDALTQYAGLKGGLEQAAEETKVQFGKESDKYKRYQRSLTAAKLLAKQVRQLFKDSITPGIQAQLQQLTNPSTWRNNPEIAKQNFNEFKKILLSETKTFKDALQSVAPYRSRGPEEEVFEESVQVTEEPTARRTLRGKSYVQINGKWYEE